MSTNKEKLVKGLYILGFTFPFVLAGPAIFAWKGASDFSEGHYLWPIVSIVCMLTAVGLGIFGLRTILGAFFDQDANSHN
ncbi:hypothetical protein GC167_03305 [bacterium]|nr:hypothetical protein [bacterium]